MTLMSLCPQQPKITIFTIILFLIAPFSYSQVIDSKISRETDYPIITGYVTLCKSTSPISFDSIRQPAFASKFTRLKNEPVIYSGYDAYYYWFRFIIRNSDTVPNNLMLLLGPNGMRDGELFQGKDQHWVSLGKNGTQYRFLKRPYQYMHFVYPITVPGPSTDTFYLYMDQHHDFMAYGFALLHPTALKTFENRAYLYFGIIIGLLLLFFTLNLFLFFSLRERIHLWYALYVGLLILLVLRNDQLYEQLLGMDSEQGFRMLPLLAMGAALIGVLMHVVELFTASVRKSLVLTRISSIVKWNLFVSAIAQYIVFFLKADLWVERLVFAWADNSALCGILMIIVNCVYSIRKGFRSALFMLAGLLGFLAGAAERLLLIGSSSYLFPPSTFHIGMILETMIISFGLIYRYRIDRKEKQALDTRLQEQKIEEAIHVISAQEAERKRIAEDLHDELGSSLAALKIKVENFNLPELSTNDHRKQITSMIDKASSDVRRIAHDLMPPEFSTVQLGVLLKSYFDQLNTDTKLVFDFIVTEEKIAFTKQEELFIYRIVLELVHNTITHAAASEASIQLIYYDTYLEIMAEDNGIGFKTNYVEGIGLRSIRSRVSYLNGTINIDSSVRGTTILINIPFTIKQHNHEAHKGDYSG